MPFDHIPGSYSTYDKAEKLAVESYVAAGITPPWMAQFGEIRRLIPAPHWSKFYFDHGGLRVRGVADMICDMASGKLLLPDFKTAKFTESQEKWIPVYTVQLGAYALAAETQLIGMVERLVLIYMQPQAVGLTSDMQRDDGVAIHHKAFAVEVPRNDEEIHSLCDRAMKILSGPPPPSQSDCQDCQNFQMVADLKKNGYQE